jgi:hypothetical protein
VPAALGEPKQATQLKAPYTSSLRPHTLVANFVPAALGERGTGALQDKRARHTPACERPDEPRHDALRDDII